MAAVTITAAESFLRINVTATYEIQIRDIRPPLVVTDSGDYVLIADVESQLKYLYSDIEVSGSTYGSAIDTTQAIVILINTI